MAVVRVVKKSSGNSNSNSSGSSGSSSSSSSSSNKSSASSILSSVAGALAGLSSAIKGSSSSSSSSSGSGSSGSGSKSSSGGGSSSSSSSYTGVGTNNDSGLNPVDAQFIQTYKDQYNAAKAKGDTSGMELAHAAAEAIRSKYNYSGGADGSELIRNGTKLDGYSNGTSSGGGSATSSYGGTVATPNAGYTYTPLGTHNDATIQEMSASDYAAIQDLKAEYEAAKLEGNTAAMEAAHRAAEEIRAQYMYSGGSDGSDYLPWQLPVEEEMAVFDIPSYSFDTSSRPTYTDEQGARPEYEDTYRSQIDDLLNGILTRDNFSYNVEEDPLYQQYKQQYLREGNRSMNDTLASAASTAGGMNSYAVTAAQQANNYYNAQLTDKIPELYQLAYDMYLDDIDQQVRDLGLVQQMDATQYNRYRDTMGDWENDRDFAYGKYRDDVGDWEDDRNFSYTQYRDSMGDYFNNRDFQYNASRDALDDARYNAEWSYATSRDSLSDSEYEQAQAYEQAMEFLSAGVMPSTSVLQAAGISTTEAQDYLYRVRAAEQLSGTRNEGEKKVEYSPKDDGGGGDPIPKVELEESEEETAEGHEVWGGVETDDFYYTSRVVRQMYNRNETDDAIAEYLADRIEDGTLTAEEALRIAKSYGVEL